MAETTDKPNKHKWLAGLVVTRTIQVTLTRSFSDDETGAARYSAIERGCSLHKVLSERLKNEAERALRNARFTVA